jgi:hypothetical protein
MLGMLMASVMVMPARRLVSMIRRKTVWGG